MKKIIILLLVLYLTFTNLSLRAQLIGDENSNCVVCAQFVPECKEGERLVLQTCEACAHCEPIECKKCRFNFECSKNQTCKNGCCTERTELKNKECIICAQVLPVCKEDEKLVPQTCEKCAYCSKIKVSKQATKRSKALPCKTPCGNKCCKAGEKCTVIDQCKNIKTKCKLPILKYCSSKTTEDLKGRTIKQN